MVKKIALLGLLMLMALGGLMVSCDDNGGGSGLRLTAPALIPFPTEQPPNWMEVARSIDTQLGDMADGTAATCGGNLLAIKGDHCKNKLLGAMTADMIVQIFRVALDIFDPADIVTLGDKNVLFRRGFVPQTRNPCTEDINKNGVEDYKDACAGPGQITCTAVGLYSYQLTYNGCIFNDGGPLYTLNGTVGVETSTSPLGELLVVGTSDNFTERENATGNTVKVSGTMARYVVLNPATGGPTLGTERKRPDGMEIFKLDVSLDATGDGTFEVGPYPVYLANDFEDGLVVLSGISDAVYVWIDFNPAPPPTLLLMFYDKNLPRNGNVNGAIAGCQVQIDLTTVNLVSRTFSYTSTGNCLGSGSNVSY